MLFAHTLLAAEKSRNESSILHYKVQGQKSSGLTLAPNVKRGRKIQVR